MCVFGFFLAICLLNVWAHQGVVDSNQKTARNSKGDRLEIISIKPEIPNVLQLEKRLNIRFTYDLVSADNCKIWVRPMLGSKRTPGYIAHGSPTYNKGRGKSEGWFTFRAPARIDQVQIVMVTDRNSPEPALELLAKADVRWEEMPATETAQLEKSQASMDPKTKQVIQQASKYISGLKSFRTEIDMKMKFEAEGMKQELTSNYSLALQKPNKLAMILNSGMFGGTFVCDGKDVYSYTPMTKKYTKENAPESLSGLDNLKGSGVMDMAVIVKLFIHENPYELIMEKVKNTKYIGLEDSNDMKFHHLMLTADLDGEETDLDVWINEGKKALVHKIIPDVSKVLEKSGQEMPGGFKDMKMEVELVFTNWEVNANIPDETFVFSPPEGAELAKPAGPHPLLGKTAPTFKLELLEGGDFDLSQQKDKNIVILDFWATWCGPCKKVMPIIEEIAEEYKDKGVVVIAVDLKEEPEKIRTFLEEQDLHPIVALDKDGKVASLYEAKSIPQTVIIGIDGMVQAVYVGSTSTTKETLKKELDALLEGKKLIPAKKK